MSFKGLLYLLIIIIGNGIGSLVTRLVEVGFKGIKEK